MILCYEACVRVRMQGRKQSECVVLVKMSKLVTMFERRFRVMMQAGESSCSGMQCYRHVGMAERWIRVVA